MPAAVDKATVRVRRMGATARQQQWWVPGVGRSREVIRCDCVVSFFVFSLFIQISHALLLLNAADAASTRDITTGTTSGRGRWDRDSERLRVTPAMAVDAAACCCLLYLFSPPLWRRMARPRTRPRGVAALNEAVGL